MLKRYAILLLCAPLFAAAPSIAQSGDETDKPAEGRTLPVPTAQEDAQRRSLNENQLEQVTRFYGDHTAALVAYEEAVAERERVIAAQEAEAARVAAEHEAAMARWREAVRRCEGGEYQYCQPQ